MRIKGKLLCLTLIPITLVGVLSGGLAEHLAEKFLIEEQQTILEVALEGYSGDVNAFQQSDVDITVFEGDTRVESSIQGVEGTKASSEVVSSVLEKGETYFSTSVDVHGIDYCGYYEPTDSGMLFAGRPKALVDESLEHLVRVIAIACGVLIVGVGVIVFLVAQSLAKSISIASQGIKSLSKGNLMTELEQSDKSDEISVMNNAIRSLAQKLKGTVEVLYSISRIVRESSAELDTTTETTMNAMNEVSKAIEDVAIGLQEQSNDVQVIADNVGRLRQSAHEVKNASDDITVNANRLSSSNSSVHSRVLAMANSNEKVNESITLVSEKIQAMNSVMDNVKGIVAVIGDISEQTNLLSLNASIEAARAGDAGRGFSVVAGEIGNLSVNTSNQVEEVTKIIKTLVQDFEECSKAIESINSDSSKQSQDIDYVVNEFGVLSSEIDETFDRVKLISTAVEQAAMQLNSVAKEVEALNEISQNFAAATEEVNASAQEINALMNGVVTTSSSLNSVSRELSDTLEFFKV